MIKLEHLNFCAKEIDTLLGVENLSSLRFIDAKDNKIRDLTPLIKNTEFGHGDWIDIRRNNLSEKAKAEQTKVIQQRGADIQF